MEFIVMVFDTLTVVLLPFVFVFVLSIIFKTFLKDDFPMWMGMIIGLAFISFNTDLKELGETSSFLTIFQFSAVVLSSALASYLGNKYADKFTNHKSDYNGYHLLKRSFYKASGKKFVEVIVPPASEILNIYGKRPVSNDLKKELGGKKFVEPCDVPIEILEARIKRRLISDWRFGDAEVKINEDGKIVKLAVAAKKSKITNKVPEGKVLFSFKPETVPFELGYGDIVDVYVDKEVIRAASVLNVSDNAVLLMVESKDGEVLASCVGRGMIPALVIVPKPVSE
jgi:hypothetical protein